MKILRMIFLPLLLLANIDIMEHLPSDTIVPSQFDIQTNKTAYHRGDSAKIRINTNGKKGYLYLFAVYGDTMSVLLPNKDYQKSFFIEKDNDIDKLHKILNFIATNQLSHQKEETKLIAMLSEVELPIEYDDTMIKLYNKLKFETTTVQAKEILKRFKGMVSELKEQKNTVYSATTTFVVLK